MLPISAVLRVLMNGMSESELSRKTKIPKTTINRLLSGQTPDPRISTVAALAKYFNISIEQLIGEKPLPPT